MDMMKKAWIVTLTACLGLALFSLPVQAETTIQILHASDLEGGVAAIGHAPNFAAVVDKLKTTQPRTLIISAGDNYLSGPFFTASADRSVRDALRKELNNTRRPRRRGTGGYQHHETSWVSRPRPWATMSSTWGPVP